MCWPQSSSFFQWLARLSHQKGFFLVILCLNFVLCSLSLQTSVCSNCMSRCPYVSWKCTSLLFGQEFYADNAAADNIHWSDAHCIFVDASPSFIINQINHQSISQSADHMQHPVIKVWQISTPSPEIKCPDTIKRWKLSYFVCRVVSPRTSEFCV